MQPGEGIIGGESLPILKIHFFLGKTNASAGAGPPGRANPGFGAGAGAETDKGSVRAADIFIQKTP